jgi:hypothetical protein
MRIAGKLKCGFYPLPLAEAKAIRKHLEFPLADVSAVDPCIGDGKALAGVTADTKARRYGMELDAYRAEQARSLADSVIQASCFDVHCPVDAVSLLYLNPPYDFETDEGNAQRTERTFLQHTCRWLKPGGVLVLVIPKARIVDCCLILASQFKEVQIRRLTAPESVRFDQVVVFGIRRARRERERLRDGEIQEARQLLADLSRHSSQIQPLLLELDFKYLVPESAPVMLVYKGLPLDEIEDLLQRSSACRQANRLLFGRQGTIEGRPLTPLHGGHIGLLCTAGMLNGIFGEDENRHIAHWQSIKVVDHFEETADDGTVTERDRERFTHRVSLVFADGRTATLGEKG